MWVCCDLLRVPTSITYKLIDIAFFCYKLQDCNKIFSNGCAMKLKFTDSLHCVLNDNEIFSLALCSSESSYFSSSQRTSIVPSSVNTEHCTLCNVYSNSE